MCSPKQAASGPEACFSNGRTAHRHWVIFACVCIITTFSRLWPITANLALGLTYSNQRGKALSAPIQNSKNKKSRLLKASFNSSSTPWSIDLFKSAQSINNSAREDMNLPYCRYERIMLMTGGWLELPYCVPGCSGQ